MSKLKKKKTRSQTERVSLLKRRDNTSFTCTQCEKFHKQTQSQETHEDTHWRETLHM